MILAVVMEKQPLNEGLKTDHFPTLFDIKPTGFRPACERKRPVLVVFGQFGCQRAIKVSMLDGYIDLWGGSQGNC